MLKRRSLITAFVTFVVALVVGFGSAPAQAASVFHFYRFNDHKVHVCTVSDCSNNANLGWVTVECLSPCSPTNPDVRVLIHDSADDGANIKFHAHNTTGGIYTYYDTPTTGNYGAETRYFILCSMVGVGGNGYKDWWVEWNGNNTSVGRFC